MATAVVVCGGQVLVVENGNGVGTVSKTQMNHPSLAETSSTTRLNSITKSHGAQTVAMGFSQVPNEKHGMLDRS